MGKKRVPMSDERRAYLLDKRANRKPLSKSHPHLSQEWCHALDVNGEIDESKSPDKQTRGSLYKVLWRKECKPGVFHEWVASIHSRAVKNTGCPRCKTSVMEKNMLKTLKKLQKELQVKEIKHGCYVKPYQCYPDFFLTLDNGKSCVIEMDGKQHFYPVSFGSKQDPQIMLEDVQRLDMKKNEACEREGWNLMRINYTINISQYEVLVKNFIIQVNETDKWVMICHGSDYSCNE